MSERIKQLEQFATEDPTDPFNFYALALEYAKADEQKALDIFRRLVRDHKDYLPSYYQLANLYVGLGDRENAIRIFNDGIVIAKQQNNLKTLHELKAGLEDLE